MSVRFNMSAGELFDLVRPAAMTIAALASTAVLVSARKRFPFLQVLLWALTVLFLPLIAFPLYLITLIFMRGRERRQVRWPILLPLLYTIIVLSSIGLYLYLDYNSVDAHLARSTRAQLNQDRRTAVSELEQALAIEDNPHTHKLLANQLAEGGFLSEAISEYRLALKGGEPDDSIHFQVGLLLERINLDGQASLEFQQFLLTPTCLGSDERCDAARARLSKAGK